MKLIYPTLLCVRSTDPVFESAAKAEALFSNKHMYCSTLCVLHVRYM